MDILYTLGNGSENDNIELRWSLRSLEKYGKNVGRIVVAGVVPDWLSDEVSTVSVPQSSWLFQKNIMSSVEAAIVSGAVSGDFILSADDHFYVKEVDFDKFPVYINGTLPTSIGSACVNYEYMLGLIGSKWLLGNAGLTTYNTSIHNCIPVSARSIYDHIGMMRACHDNEYRMNVWALLGNMYLYSHQESKPKNRRDIKIEHEIAGEDELLKIIGNEPFFSIDDGIFGNEVFLNYMNELYPNKSKWEK